MPESTEKKPIKKTVRKPASESKPSPTKESAAEKKPATAVEKVASTTRYVVEVPLLNIREKESLSSKILGTLGKGEQVEVTATSQGFGKLAGKEGYIKLEYTKALDGE